MQDAFVGQSAKEKKKGREVINIIRWSGRRSSILLKSPTGREEEEKEMLTKVFTQMVEKGEEATFREGGGGKKGDYAIWWGERRRIKIG